MLPRINPWRYLFAAARLIPPAVSERLLGVGWVYRVRWVRNVLMASRVRKPDAEAMAWAKSEAERLGL